MEKKQNSGFVHWIRTSVTFKAFLTGFIALLLLIPNKWIRDLIYERENNKKLVELEISQKWGSPQTFSGPVLSVPYETKDKDENVYIEYLHFLPENLDVQGDVSPTIRYRGIYKTVVYNSILNVSGHFAQPGFSRFRIDQKNIFWEDAFVSIGISDLKGVQNNFSMLWNEENLDIEPGLKSSDVLQSGITAAVPLTGLFAKNEEENTEQETEAETTETKKYHFNMTIELNGSKSLNFLPLGKETTVTINSGWATPSFQGNFLPEKRDIFENGFSAKWKVIYLNRNYPQQWQGKKHDVESSSFGVLLLLPVDHYQKTTRSSKYAILFIALTFLVFFLMEVMNKRKMHSIQYLLVGLGLCVFYALLLSLSEKIYFTWAYIVSGIAVVGLITGYTAAIFKNLKLTLLMGSLLAVLYGFLFVILQQEDYALLIGSIGLFIILAIVMFVTRKIDWYKTSLNNE